MLVFRIIATVLVGISCFTAFAKNIAIFKEDIHQDRQVFSWTFYGWLWRAFVIVALWVI